MMVQSAQFVNRSVGGVVRHLRSILTPLYGAGEARAMVRLIFLEVMGWDQTAMIVNEDREMSDYALGRISAIMERLKKGEPLQYVLGKARFYGMDLGVDRNVLIPRPETEELVDLVVDTYRSVRDLRVLDIGTGSGAIAIALARNLLFPQVTAMDVSVKALDVARRNACSLKAHVDFVEADIFAYTPPADGFDIIISNPPYICESERADMERNVLDYEPSFALFVPDAAPLLYYNRIAEVAMRGLTPGGSLYFEINPLYAKDIKAMLSHYGYMNIEMRKDVSGRERFIIARKPMGS